VAFAIERAVYATGAAVMKGMMRIAARELWEHVRILSGLRSHRADWSSAAQPSDPKASVVPVPRILGAWESADLESRDPLLDA
jgi:hypothetical protein